MKLKFGKKILNKGLRKGPGKKILLTRNNDLESDRIRYFHWGLQKSKNP